MIEIFLEELKISSNLQYPQLRQEAQEQRVYLRLVKALCMKNQVVKIQKLTFTTASKDEILFKLVILVSIIIDIPMRAFEKR